MGMSLLMFIVGYSRYGGAPGQLQMKFWFASGQFRSGTAFMLAFWVAFLVAERAKEDTQNRRFQRIIIALERLMEEISSFRVETDHLRMEEHEAVQRNESAQITYQQTRQNKLEVTDTTTKKRRRKKNVDKELSAWAPNVKMDNYEEFKMKTQKAIEDSFKRLPPLPDHFRRDGGDRMLKFEEKGYLGGVEEHTRHIKAPWQMVRGEARPTGIEIIPPSQRAAPPPRRPPMPPPPNFGLPGIPAVPSLEDLRRNALGETPPMGANAPLGLGGWDQPPDLGVPEDDVPLRSSMREAMRAASGSLPGSRARTHSLGGDRTPPFLGDRTPPLRGDRTPPEAEPLTPPVLPPWPATSFEPSEDALARVPPLEPLEDPPTVPIPKAKRARRRGSKDLPDEEPNQASADIPAVEAAERSDLRDAGAAGGPPPLPPSPEQTEQP